MAAVAAYQAKRHTRPALPCHGHFINAFSLASEAYPAVRALRHAAPRRATPRRALLVLLLALLPSLILAQVARKRPLRPLFAAPQQQQKQQQKQTQTRAHSAQCVYSLPPPSLARYGYCCCCSTARRPAKPSSLPRQCVRRPPLTETRTQDTAAHSIDGKTV